MPPQTDWIDGPKLVAWLEESDILTAVSIQVGRDDECRIRAWRGGGAADYYVADRILCKLGVCIGELPESFFRSAPDRTIHGRVDTATERRIVRLYREHQSFRAVARIVGRGEKTVARCVRGAAAHTVPTERSTTA
jgi:hypothetical protein